MAAIKANPSFLRHAYATRHKSHEACPNTPSASMSPITTSADVVDGISTRATVKALAKSPLNSDLQSCVQSLHVNRWVLSLPYQLSTMAMMRTH